MTTFTRFAPVLFDLDGTITDSAPVICESIKQTFLELGHPPQSEEQLRCYVGPPLREGFLSLSNISEEKVDQAIAVFRSFYEKKMHEAAVYPGIREILSQLKEREVKLAVATSKYEQTAIDILAAQGLDKYFSTIAGATADGRIGSKSSVVSMALRRLGSPEKTFKRPVLIGDKEHDIKGAAANHIESIIVTWGYGKRSEYTGALAISETPSDLASLLGLPRITGSLSDRSE